MKKNSFHFLRNNNYYYHNYFFYNNNNIETKRINIKEIYCHTPPFHGHGTHYLTVMHGLTRQKDFQYKGFTSSWIHRQSILLVWVSPMRVIISDILHQWTINNHISEFNTTSQSKTSKLMFMGFLLTYIVLNLLILTWPPCMDSPTK